MKGEKTARLEQISQEVTYLTASPLYQYRIEKGYLPVIGDGNPDADLMFIGEAPGVREAETGIPFIGSAGSVPDSLLASIGI